MASSLRAGLGELRPLGLDKGRHLLERRGPSRSLQTFLVELQRDLSHTLPAGVTFQAFLNLATDKGDRDAGEPGSGFGCPPDRMLLKGYASGHVRTGWVFG